VERWQERVIVAYLDEPPFGVPTGPGVRPSGCDMDLAHHVLTAVGAANVDYRLTTFPELIPGLLDERWDMTTPIFVTDERAEIIGFSRAVWAAEDGFVVRRSDVHRYAGYEAIAASPSAVLAVVEAQVQRQTALRAGVPHERIVEFPDQDAAVAAVRDGSADASASTAAGNRAYLQRAGEPTLAAVTDRSDALRGLLPQGAFAFGPAALGLRAAVDHALGRYLGTPEHLDVMARYGFSPLDLQGVIDL
jgi:polar amino acid transport system substrate-binding protein